MPEIAVTGACGQVGGRVARRLAQRGVEQRLVVRDPSRAPVLDGAEVQQASYEDSVAMRRAMCGIHSVFLVSAHGHPERVRQHVTAIDAALSAGVQRIVYLSFVAASPDATFTNGRDHYHTEAHLRARAVPHVVLRSSFYTDEVPRWCASNGVIRGPAGDGRVAWVTRDDVAAVAAAVLTDPRHDGGAYEVTGPEAMTLTQTAAVLATASGRPISFEQESLEEARASRRGTGAEPWRIEGWVSSYAAIAEGAMDVVSGAVHDITGTAPTSLERFLAAHPETCAHLAPC